MAKSLFDKFCDHHEGLLERLIDDTAPTLEMRMPEADHAEQVGRIGALREALAGFQDHRAKFRVDDDDPDDDPPEPVDFAAPGLSED